MGVIENYQALTTLEVTGKLSRSYVTLHYQFKPLCLVSKLGQ